MTDTSAPPSTHSTDVLGRDFQGEFYNIFLSRGRKEGGTRVGGGGIGGGGGGGGGGVSRRA